MPHRNSIQLALHLSESFGELVAKSTESPNAKTIKKRWYWPSNKPSSIVKEILQQFEGVTEVKFFIALRFFEKVFDRRLSGNVAQVVTSGFENWLYLRQPLEGPAFSPSSQRRAPLANAELVFALSERISSEGDIIRPIELPELEFIAAKLKLMKVEKLAINLLHGGRFSQHENFAKEYFESQGFRVFLASHRGGREDEVQRWRRNLMNAGMSGTIEDTLADLKSPFDELNIKCEFQISTTSGLKQSLDTDEYLDTLMGPWRKLLKHKDQQAALLYLGLEKFVWMNQEMRTEWISPWGPVNMQTPRTRYLRMQPTLRLESGWLSEVEISNHEEGFEPGPMSFGRSVKPTIFDIWSASSDVGQVSGLENLLQPTGISRFNDMVKVWLRSARKIGSKDEAAQIKELRSSVLDQLSLEIDLLPDPDRIILCGPMAAPLGRELQNRTTSKKIEIDTTEGGFIIPNALLASTPSAGELK